MPTVNRPLRLIAYGTVDIGILPASSGPLLATNALAATLLGSELVILSAVSSLGHHAEFCTVLPTGVLGDAATRMLIREGVKPINMSGTGDGHVVLWVSESSTTGVRGTALVESGGQAVAERGVSIAEFDSALAPSPDYVLVASSTLTRSMSHKQSIANLLEAAKVSRVPLVLYVDSPIDGGRALSDSDSLFADLLCEAAVLVCQVETLRCLVGPSSGPPARSVESESEEFRTASKAVLSRYSRMAVIGAPYVHSGTSNDFEMTGFCRTRESFRMGPVVSGTYHPGSQDTEPAFVAGFLHAVGSGMAANEAVHCAVGSRIAFIETGSPDLSHWSTNLLDRRRQL